MGLNWRVGDHFGQNIAKKRIISKNASHKSCSELNFLQKTQWTHISIFPRSGARGAKHLPFLKYIDVLEWKSRFTLGLNAAKSTDCIEKFFK